LNRCLYRIYASYVMDEYKRTCLELRAGGGEKGLGADDRFGSLQAIVTPPEEVRPMNAVSTWVLPLPVTAGD